MPGEEHHEHIPFRFFRFGSLPDLITNSLELIENCFFGRELVCQDCSLHRFECLVFQFGTDRFGSSLRLCTIGKIAPAKGIENPGCVIVRIFQEFDIAFCV